MKNKKIKLKILSIDFQNGITLNAEVIEEPVVEQTSLFPDENQTKTSPPRALTNKQIENLVQYGKYSVDEVLSMPIPVALVRLGNLTGAYYAQREVRTFIPTNHFPEEYKDYQDPWLTKDDPVSYAERRAAKKQFDFTRPLPEDRSGYIKETLLEPIRIDALKPKRGRPRKKFATVI
jgi:hypothetical protein